MYAGLKNSVFSFFLENRTSSITDSISKKVSLFGSQVGRYRCIHDSDVVVREMIKDKIKGILLLERTGRVFLPILQALYKKQGLPFPLWKSFDPGPNPLGHTLDANSNFQEAQKGLSEVENIAVFDEYMVSGIRLKNTILALQKEHAHPVRGYVLQNQKGAEDATVQMDIFSAGSHYAKEYLEIRNGFTNRTFLPSEPMQFRACGIMIPVYRQTIRKLLQEVEKFPLK